MLKNYIYNNARGLTLLSSGNQRSNVVILRDEGGKTAKYSKLRAHMTSATQCRGQL